MEAKNNAPETGRTTHEFETKANGTSETIRATVAVNHNAVKINFETDAGESGEIEQLKPNGVVFRQKATLCGLSGVPGVPAPKEFTNALRADQEAAEKEVEQAKKARENATLDALRENNDPSETEVRNALDLARSVRIVNAAAFHDAHESGERVRVATDSVACDDAHEECSTDRLDTFVTPTGTLEFERTHTF